MIVLESSVSSKTQFAAIDSFMNDGAHVNIMKKSLMWVVGVVLIVAVIAGMYVFNQSKTEGIKIGFISPMSGNAAGYGDYVRKAFQLGLDEWNSNHNLKLEVVYEDGKCAPADAVAAANKLINIDRVDLIMTFCTGETNAVSPITESNKMILFTAGTTAPNFKKGSYTFRNIGSIGTGLPILTQLAYQNNPKMAIISESTDYAFSSKEGFKQKYTSLGGTVLFDETFDSKNAEFKTIISKLKDANVASIFVVVQSLDNSAILFKQMKQLDYHPRIFSEQASISVKALDKYKAEGYEDIVEGTTFVQSYFDRTNPKAKHLLDSYAEKYGGSTAGPIPENYLATHYDAVYLIGEAATKVGSNSDSIRQYFLTEIKNWDGADGKFSFDETGDAIIPVQTYTVKDGVIVPYSA